MRLLFGLGAFERLDLSFGQQQPVLRRLGLQRFQPLLHRLQVMTLPDAAHPGRGDG